MHSCSNFSIRRQMAPVQSIKLQTANFSEQRVQPYELHHGSESELHNSSSGLLYVQNGRCIWTVFVVFSMPHISSSLLARRCKNGLTKFTNYRPVYPYQVLLPPALKDEVSRKGGERSSTYHGRSCCSSPPAVFRLYTPP